MILSRDDIAAQMLKAPHLAQIVNAITANPSIQTLKCASALYAHAREEMATICDGRGFPLSQDEILKRAGTENFMVLGRAVIEVRNG